MTRCPMCGRLCRVGTRRDPWRIWRHRLPLYVWSLRDYWLSPRYCIGERL